MSVVLDPGFAVADAADYQCALTHRDRGRCARHCEGEEHHIVLQSQGGHDGPTAWICPYHHRLIHPGPYSTVRLERLLVGPAIAEGNVVEMERDDGSGVWVYRQHGTDRQGSDGDLWEVWNYPYVRERWEADAHEVMHQAVAYLDEARYHAWHAAYYLYELTFRNLWPHLGLGIETDPDDPYRPLRQFAQYIDYRPKYLRGLVRAEKYRRQLPADERETARRAPVRLMIHKGATILALPPAERQDKVWAAVEAGTPSEAIKENLDDDRKAAEAKELGKRRWRVRMHLEADAEIDVTASDAAEAIEIGRSRVAGYKPIRGCCTVSREAASALPMPGEEG